MQKGGSFVGYKGIISKYLLRRIWELQQPSVVCRPLCSTPRVVLPTFRSLTSRNLQKFNISSGFARKYSFYTGGTVFTMILLGAVSIFVSFLESCFFRSHAVEWCKCCWASIPWVLYTFIVGLGLLDPFLEDFRCGPEPSRNGSGPSSLCAANSANSCQKRWMSSSWVSFAIHHE